MPLTVWSLAAEAQERRIAIDVGATDLPTAISELARETGASLGAEGPLPRLRTRPVRGTLPVARALARMLAGTGYRARQVGANAWRIEPAPRAAVAPPAIRVPAAPLRQSPPSAGTPPAEIVVTATKDALKLGSSPNAVTVLLPTSLNGPPASAGTAAVAAQTDAMTLTGEGAGRNRMFLRGVADSAFAGRSQATVALLMGDARLTWSAPDPDLRLVDVRQVEVLKGPQGSLYGTGALGGIYRIVPQPPDPAQLHMSAEAAGSVASAGDIGGSGALMLNLPLVRDRAALRLVAYGEREPGWIDTGERTDSNPATALGGRAAFGVAAGGGWQIDATALGQFLNSKDSSYVYAPHARNRPAQLAEPHDNDLVHGSLRIAHAGGPVTLTATSGYTHHAVNDRYDATEGADQFGLPDPRTLDLARTYTVWDNELRANGSWRAAGWLAGVSHLVATQDQSRKLTWANNTGLPLDRDYRRSTETAVYGRVTAPIAARIDLVAGARVSRATLAEARTRKSARDVQAERNLALTPSLKLAWRPRPGQIFYAGYDTAIREGGSTLGPDGGATRLDGDEIGTLSLGWRETRGALRFDLGAYASRWRSVQSDVLGAGGLIETANVGNATIEGVEAAFDADLAAGWHLAAGGTIQSALLDPTGAPEAAPDRRLPVVPQASARISLTREMRWAGWAVRARLAAHYVGRGRLSFDPALDRKLGGYLDTAFALSATHGAWALRLDASNLLDQRADVFAYGNPLRLAGRAQYVGLTPRRISLSLGWQR